MWHMSAVCENFVHPDEGNHWYSRNILIWNQWPSKTILLDGWAESFIFSTLVYYFKLLNTLITWITRVGLNNMNLKSIKNKLMKKQTGYFKKYFADFLAQFDEESYQMHKSRKTQLFREYFAWWCIKSAINKIDLTMKRGTLWLYRLRLWG